MVATNTITKRKRKYEDFLLQDDNLYVNKNKAPQMALKHYLKNE